jgi:hypothetical protein
VSDIELIPIRQIAAAIVLLGALAPTYLERIGL